MAANNTGTPSPDCFTRHTELLGDLSILQTPGGGQDDSGSRNDAHFRATAVRQSLQLGSFTPRQYDCRCDSHEFPPPCRVPHNDSGVTINMAISASYH